LKEKEKPCPVCVKREARMQGLVVTIARLNEEILRLKAMLEEVAREQNAEANEVKGNG
jgi:hypothetical protein